MVVDFWSQENPNLDLLVKGLAIRLRRASHHLDRALRQQLGGGDIEVWEAEVSGPPTISRPFPQRRRASSKISR